MKKTIFIIFLGLILLAPCFVWAQSAKVQVLFFYTSVCPHCLEEKIFLEALESKYEALEIKKHLVSEKENIALLEQFYKEYNVPSGEQGWVPVSFIDERYFLGYQGDESTGKEIEDYIKQKIEEIEPDSPSAPWLPDEPGPAPGEKEPENGLKVLKIPFLGEVDISKFSPLALSVVFGALDGFNACAMLALGFLLAVLASTGQRKRIILIGGTFILVSGIVYFLFISAWLNLFMCLSNIGIITNLIGIIICVFAVILLKEYFWGTICRLCQISMGKQSFLTKFQTGLFEKMTKFSSLDAPLFLSLLGVAGVAAGINMVEICCSFGFPLAFTKILTGLNLPAVSYYFYLLVYIVFYMLDDFLIFLLAVLTLKITKASEKYLKAVKLISGILLLVLGILMLIKPELLMFG